MRKPTTNDHLRLPFPVATIPSDPAPLQLERRPDMEDDGPGGPHRAVPNDGLARFGLRCETDPAHNAPFEVDFSLSQLPGLQMASGRLHGACTRRSCALVDQATDDAALIVNIRGRHLIEQRGREIALGDGEAVIVSWTEPSRLTHLPPGEALALRFPRARLAPLLRQPDSLYMQVIPCGNKTLGILTHYVALAWNKRMAAGPDLQQLMASHIYDLIAVLISPTPIAAQMLDAGGLRAARLGAIKQDIEGSLGEPGLSAAAIAARHGCTVRCVQRLFEGEGTTFTEYVLSRRIARAHRLLGDPLKSGEKISAVAYTCGFGDVSYFNRVFRRVYGLSPSDVRAQAR